MNKDREQIKRELDAVINLPEFAKYHGVKPGRSGSVFHSIYSEDKNPSLSFFRNRGRWLFKCHSTGKTGDYIEFVKDLLNVDYPGAVKYLAGFYHIITEGAPVTVDRPAIIPERKPEAGQTFTIQSDLFDELAGKYEDGGLSKEASEAAALRDLRHNVFTGLLNICAPGFSEPVRRFFISRGITRETVRRFRIAEMREPAETKRALIELFDPGALRLAGVMNERGNLVLHFHRVLIPYFTGETCVHIKGRALPEFGANMETTPKYLNVRGKIPGVLYNENALQDTRRKGRIYLTEGEFDAVILEQNGLPAVSLLSATNIPADLPQKLRGLFVFVLTDNDAAGETAGHKILKELETAGVKAERKILPPGVKDVTEFITYLKGRQ